MPSTSSERDPVEMLADEFVQRRRRGETPSLTEYVQRFPELAKEIKAVFPAILALEKVGPHATEPSVGLTPKRAEITRTMAEAIGDYRILREVGRGAMGVVYEAEQQSLDRRVALKVLPWHSVGNAKAVERFRREARAAARLHHTNIVPVFDVGQEGEVCYFAMQFIQGQSLDNVMVELRHLRAGVVIEPSQGDAKAGELPAASSLALSMYTEAFAQSHAIGSGDDPATAPARRRGGNAIAGSSGDRPAPDTVSFKQPSTIPGSLYNDPKARSEAYRAHYYRSVAHIAERAADALAYAHERGVIHRDVKPSNLMLDAAGVVWVTDFGLAKTNDESLTRSGDLLGTLRYMAPERFNGVCDERADVYSLGATLYELLCLRPVRDANDGADLIAQITRSEPAAPREFDPRIPLDLERIVMKAIDRDPRHRYQSAAALAEDLRRFLSDQPILGRRVSPTERFTRWARRNRMLATVTVGGISLLITGLIVSSIATASFSALAKREQTARVETTSNLYHSLVRESQATRLARREGYREQAWSLLRRARELDTPEVDVGDLRREAIQSLGDFVGQTPITLGDFPTEVSSAAVSPDGKVAVVGLANGVIRWYDVASGKLQQENKQHSAAVNRVAFDREGKIVLSADIHGMVRSWRKQDDHWQVREHPSLGREVLDLEPVHEGLLLAVTKPSANFSDIGVENLAHKLTGRIVPPVPMNAVALNRAGTLLAGVGDEDVYVWHPLSGATLQRTTTTLGPLKSVTFSHDGKLLFCGSAQGLVVFDLPELRQQTFMRYDEVPLGAFGPEGVHVAFASVNRRITLWSVHANRELAVLTHPGWTDLHSLSFAENGRVLLSADAETVRIWDVRGGPERTTFSGHAAAVNGAAFSPDGSRLASIGIDRTVMLWDVKSGRRTAITSLPAAGRAIAFPREGATLIVGDAAGQVQVLDDALRLLKAAEPKLGPIHAIRCSPVGDLVAICGESGAALWKHGSAEEETANDKKKQTAWINEVRRLPGAECLTAEFSPDGQFIAWVDQQRKLRLAETESGVEWPLSAPLLLRGWQNLAFDASGERVMFVNQEGRVVAWNIVTDALDHTLGEPSSFQGTHLAASSDGRWLAVDALPMQLSVWNLQSREPFFVFREEPSAVNVTVWSRNSRLLAVGGKDGSLSVWDLPALQKELKQIDLDWPAAADEQKQVADERPPLERLRGAVDKDPENLRLRLRLSMVESRSGKAEAALQSLDKMLEAQPDQRQALIARAHLHAQAKSWQKAADDYLAAINLDQPSSLEEWQTAALLLALAGDDKAYKWHCEAMLERITEDAGPAALEHVVWACSLKKQHLPEFKPHYDRLRAILERGGAKVDDRAHAWLAVALATQRAGDSYEAMQQIRRAQDETNYSQTPRLQALAFAVLALAQQSDGQASVARTSLETAADFRQRADEASGAFPQASQRHDLLLVDLLSTEVTELLKNAQDNDEDRDDRGPPGFNRFFPRIRPLPGDFR